MRRECVLPPSWQSVVCMSCVHVGTNQVGVVFTRTEVGVKGRGRGRGGS